MAPRRSHRILFASAALILTACAGFKETKVGHFFDNVGARYNGYFNAKEKVLASQLSIEENHIDDFNNILDVLRLGDEKTGKNHAAEMDEAAKKCVRVIQRHKGSDWVDNSYFVIAQSYFVKGDYYAALDLFKFLSSEYPDTEVAFESQLWIALSYCQIGKYDDAQAYIVNALKNRDFPDDLRTDAELINAHIKIKVLNYSDAIKSLEKAIPEVHRRPYKNRYIFILAQLYQETGNTRKAIEYYEKIENRNMPYEFLFQTRINIAKCTDLRRRTSAEKVIKSFSKLLKDDNNRDYFDQIYHEIGRVYQIIKDEEQAIENYQRSAFYGKTNLTVKANNYLQLGDIFFDRKDYVIAGAYYDSCANVIPPDHEQYADIKAQQVILSELITNLTTINTQDSLLHWASVSKEELDAQIERVKKMEAEAAEKAKAQEELRKRREEIAEDQDKGSLDPSLMRSGGSDDWYFYNPRTLGVGHTRFVQKWGNRPDEDDWRRSKKIRNNFSDNDLDEDTTEFAETEDTLVEEEIVELPFDPASIAPDDVRYYEELPFLPAQKKAAESKVIEALYGNGVLYYEKLANYPLSEEAFNTLLERFPENKFELPTKYYLYKLHSLAGDSVKALALKEEILSKYPTSEYAKLLSGNTDFALDYDVNPELEQFYKTAYQEFQSGNCQQAISMGGKADTLFTDNYLRPNFEFLRIVCENRSKPDQEFIPVLQTFVNTYVGLPVTQDAQNIIRYLERRKAAKEKAKADSTKSFQDSVKKHVSKEEVNEKLNIPYKYTESGDFLYVAVVELNGVKANKVQTAFSDFNRKYHRSKDLAVQSYYWKDQDKIVIYVIGLKDMRMAVAYHKGLVDDVEFINTNRLENSAKAFISKDNFKLLIKAKSEEEYMEFFDANYGSVIEQL